jgi:ubiquinone/menaquinone biosynthesis C-methylase UbiE
MAYFSSNNIVGLDYLWNWKEKFPFVQWVKATSECLPFREQKIFEFTLWMDGPEHSVEPDKILSSLSRITKYIVLSCPFRETPGVNQLHFQSLIDERKILDWTKDFEMIELLQFHNQLIYFGKAKGD